MDTERPSPAMTGLGESDDETDLAETGPSNLFITQLLRIAKDTLPLVPSKEVELNRGFNLSPAARKNSGGSVGRE